MTSTSTTNPLTPHLPHVHLPAPALVAAAVAGLVVIGLWLLSQRGGKKSKLVDGVLADVHGVLKVDAHLKHVFGRPPTRWKRGQLEYACIKYGDGHRDTVLKNQQQLELTLGARLGYPVHLHWNHGKHVVTVTRRVLPPLIPTFVRNPASKLTGHLLPFGVSHAGRVVLVDLYETPHILVVGSTGAGKSSAIRTLVVAAVNLGMRVNLCDPKRITFRGFRDWPGVEVATTNEAMLRAINTAYQEQERRYQGIEDDSLDPDKLVKYLLIVDELHELIERLQNTDAFEQIQSIARMGREGAVHLMVGIQRPDTAIISGSFRDQLACRISIGHLTRALQTMVGTTENVTDSAKGRGLCVVGEQATEFQTYWTPNPANRHLSKEDRQILSDLRPPNPIIAPVIDLSTRQRVSPTGINPPLAPDVVEQILELKKQDPNMTQRAIAAKLGITQPAVHKHLKKARENETVR